MAEEYERDTVFIGVSNRDSIEDGLDYRDRFEVPYPLAHAPSVWDDYNVPYQPVTVVIGRDGAEVHRFDGPVSEESLREVLEEIL